MYFICGRELHNLRYVSWLQPYFGSWFDILYSSLPNNQLRCFQEWCTEKDIDSNSSFSLFLAEKNPLFFHFANAERRTVALYAVVIILTMPFVLYKHLDYLSQIRNLSKRMKSNNEEVPIKKRIAYMVDVCFSVYPYAKLLALLFATIFLIGFGGLALYAVNKNSFAEALWLSWTFVADSGNHADTEGLGPRIVSVSISSGGMLIFAMMLGLVSDAISEKVDSLRKGKSEVIEMNHILILGWSDKLVNSRPFLNWIHPLSKIHGLYSSDISILLSL